MKRWRNPGKLSVNNATFSNIIERTVRSASIKPRTNRRKCSLVALIEPSANAQIPVLWNDFATPCPETVRFHEIYDTWPAFGTKRGIWWNRREKQIILPCVFVFFCKFRQVPSKPGASVLQKISYSKRKFLFAVSGLPFKHMCAKNVLTFEQRMLFSGLPFKYVLSKKREAWTF